MAETLLKYETIESAQIDDLMAGRTPSPPKDWSEEEKRVTPTPPADAAPEPA